MSMETNPIFETIYRLNVGKKLDLNLLRDAFFKLLLMKDSPARDVQLGCLLTGLMVKKPTVDELSVILEAAFSLDHVSPYNQVKESINIPHGKLITAVGSGKKGVKTINISTTSMLVASSLGVYTAKPGASSVSSLTGSIDLARGLGINVDIPLKEMKNVIRKTGFGLFPIEKYLTHFGELYNNKLYTPHILSFGLAALANPIRTDKLLYGLTHPDVETSVRLLNRFGFKDAMVIACTHDRIHFIDEFGIYGKTKVIGVKDGVVGKIRKFQPTDILGLPKYTFEDIRQGGSVDENIKLVVDVLRGKGKAALKDIVAINTSAILYLDDKVGGIEDGYKMAIKCIQGGHPIEKLKEIIEATGGNYSKLNKYIK